MIEEFTVQYRAQREWGWLAILDFFLAGSGAGLYVIGVLLRIDIALPVGLLATAAGAVALLADLGRPERFWRAIARPGSSWISRGAIMVTLFVGFGLLYLLIPANLAEIRALSGVVAAIAGIGVMSYTGFLLAASRGIPAWHSALMPIQFVCFSLLAGCGALYLLLPAGGEASVSIRSVQLIELTLGVGALLALFAYVMTLGSGARAARYARDELVRGSLSVPFLGSIIVGVILPTCIVAYLWFTGGETKASTIPLAIAGVLLLLGGLFIRYSLLKAGVYQPSLELH